jgi:hypothetical protein
MGAARKDSSEWEGKRRESAMGANQSLARQR